MKEAPSQLDLRDLHLVRTIAERGGVTAAARALHLSQSAVSHHLSRLEERLGVALFRRVGRKLQITAQGEKLVALSREVGDRVAAVERELRAHEGRRELRLTTQCYTAYHWLPGLLERFSAASPGVRVRVVFDAVDPLEQLREGKLELALCHWGVPKDTPFCVHPLMCDALVALVASDHPIAGRERVRARDLVGEVVLVHDLSGSALEEQGRLLFEGTAGPKGIERIPLTEAIVQLVRAGRGVSILSRWAVAAYADDPGLSFVPMTGPYTTRDWVAVTDPRSPLRAPVEALVRCIQQDPMGTACVPSSAPVK